MFLTSATAYTSHERLQIESRARAATAAYAVHLMQPLSNCFGLLFTVRHDQLWFVYRLTNGDCGLRPRCCLKLVPPLSNVQCLFRPRRMQCMRCRLLLPMWAVSVCQSASRAAQLGLTVQKRLNESRSWVNTVGGPRTLCKTGVLTLHSEGRKIRCSLCQVTLASCFRSVRKDLDDIRG